MLSTLFDFIGRLWQGIGLALSFSPDLLQRVEAYPESRTLIITMAILAGMSLLLGQSIVLFLNRVKPGRFIVSLIVNGLLYVLSLMVWGFSIWLIGSWLFEVNQPLGTVMRLVALGAAPFIFGFLILMPYLGLMVARILYVWSFLIVLRAVEFTYQVDFWPALVCVGLSWLLMLGLSHTIGIPIVALRNWVWNKLIGSPMYGSAQDILLTFGREIEAGAVGTRRQS
ncbi:MAG TPA: hypothetical protein VEC96_18080 [Anaerolineae bacterium]|nr:hypothetical protein [Anaerolineae bacterium]